MAMFGVVVGIDNFSQTPNAAKVYRVLFAQVQLNKKDKLIASGEWSFKKAGLDERTLLEKLGKVKFLNVTKSEDNKIKGFPASLDRFKPVAGAAGHNQRGGVFRPIVILSELISSEGFLIGYKIATANGEVKNIINKELIAFCNRAVKAGAIPIQNGMFVAESNGVKAHIKSYPNSPFITETLQVNKNKHVEKANVRLANNEKTLNKLEEIYSKEQIHELRLGKKAEVDIRVYANPNLSAEQMSALRKGLAKGVDPKWLKLIASPAFSKDCMNFYIADLESGCDIRSYVNPKYNIHQLSVLSIGAEAGVDISKFSNPELTATEMQEIEERLESAIYKHIEVDMDGSWKVWR